MINKALLKSLLIRFSGYEAYKWLTLKDGLYCFNYHRIGDSDQTLFDPNVYSCTAEEFQKQLKFIKSNFEVITLKEAISLTQEKKPLNKRYALITFDDGYVDNYDVAFPILKEENLSAVFFIPTDYVESNIVPWWDEIAWMLKNTTKTEFSFAGSKIINIKQASIEKVIRNLLTIIKNDSRCMEYKMLELKRVLGCEYQANPNDKSLFVTWEHLKEMQKGGMNIGSHTCSHRILTHIDKESQLKELKNSKMTLETNLGAVINSVAYPVGQRNTFNQVICNMAKDIGYEMGFSFTNEMNEFPLDNHYQVSRLGIDNHPSLMTLRQKIINSRKS
jgi:peptidoglycan/xylan/chitin deacetylase (PgdA/CDA1 family)